ncbi:MAG: DUF2851 family protein, partial [Flavobacterium sp.]
MKEDFLHHVWQFKKFDIQNLRTVRGESLSIINSGQYLQQSGPDFFNAQVVIDGQRWAGNVEIHIKSSDWYVHRHETDAAYDNVILHVVWDHDTEVFNQGNVEIPVLEIKSYVQPELLSNYNLLSTAKSWIYCEKELASVDSFLLENWKERLFFERLQRKAQPILTLASSTENDWEAVLFCFLAKNFGLNTNGEIFYQIAESIPFSIIRKESFEPENIEALLFGRAGLLEDDKEDLYFRDLKSRYEYICHKHRLAPVHIDSVEFFRHRPDNFPTIRLSQLAQLYHTHQNLFSKIINAATIGEIYNVFKVKASPYWQTHYQFDKESPAKRKQLTTAFIDLIIINTVVPFRFAYAQSQGKESSEALISLLKEVAAEKNSVMDKFRFYKIPVENAYDSQSLLQLKNEYCTNKRCMQCTL